MLAGEGLDWRPRPVERELDDGRRAGELLFPERELCIDDTVGDLRASPGDEVRELDWQLLQWRWLAVNICGIERRELAQQHTDGPRIGDDVVEREQEHVLVRVQSH